MSEKQPAVYILSNKKGGVLYTGVTSNLPKRVYQHQTHQVDGFSKKSQGSELKQWSGRTATNKIVNFTCNHFKPNLGEDLIGKLTQVRIDDVLPNSLSGSMA